MRRFANLGVFVVAVLALQMTSVAQDGAKPQVAGVPALPPTGFVPNDNSVAKFAAKRTGEAAIPNGAYNGYSHLRSSPDLGAPGSAGSGFHHFMMPMDRYTNWYRPRAATLTQFQRCAPDSFRPRGFGHLFARPCDGFRMEYEPYLLSDGLSSYGPAYIARMPDPRCPDCDCCSGKDCKECKSCKH